MNNKEKSKKIDDMDIIELKSVLFDIDNEIKQRQQMYQQVATQLQNKINEQK